VIRSGWSKGIEERGGRARARSALAIVLALATGGCGATPPMATPSTGGIAASPSPSPIVDPTPTFSPSAAPNESPSASPAATPDPLVPTPLPEPTLTEPSDIAEALFERHRVSEGVVSLVAAMGVAVYDQTDALLREGADRGAGELWLTEDEIRALIAMTEEDLLLVGDQGGPFPLADLHAAVAPGLPAGFSLDDLATAYTDAYSDEPGSLAAQVLRGQSIDRASGLLRVQMWVLLIDGFVGSAEARTGRGSAAAMAPRVASGQAALGRLPPGAVLGAARQHLPALTSPAAPLTPQEWAELLSHFPTLASHIRFESEKFGDAIHEGHGGPGDSVSWGVLVHPPRAIVSRQTGRVLLAPLARPGVAITWTSPHPAIWNAHGAFDRPLGQATPSYAVAPAHGQLIGFEPKKEDANGAGTVLREFADLEASASALDLVRHGFDVGALPAGVLGLIAGRRTAFRTSYYPIAWHQKGDGWFVKIIWTDFFNGIPDTITFRGIIDKQKPVPGQPNYFVGTGQAFGSRDGWKSCNPGIDVAPSGTGTAEFQGGIEGDELVIAAWPAINHPLSGIFAGPFRLPVEGGAAQQPAQSVNVQPDPLCPHSQAWTVELTRFGTP
jgi:hypothetical protein